MIDNPGMPAGARTAIAAAPAETRASLRKAYAAVSLPAALHRLLVAGDPEQLRALRQYERDLLNWIGDGEVERRFVVEQSGFATRRLEVMAVDAEEAEERVEEGDWATESASEWEVEVSHSETIGAARA